jgi:hypothetical protein
MKENMHVINAKGSFVVIFFEGQPIYLSQSLLSIKMTFDSMLLRFLKLIIQNGIQKILLELGVEIMIV